MKNFRVFGFFTVAAMAMLGCSNPTSSAEYKSLKSEVDGIFVEVRSLQTENDSLQNEVDSSDSLAKKLEDLKTERGILIGDLTTLLSVPSRRSAVINKLALPACKTFTFAHYDLMGKYEDTEIFNANSAYKNELKGIISAMDYNWSSLRYESEDFPAGLNQYITEVNFNKCLNSNLGDWFKEKCETFDRMMLKKDTNSYIGKCLRGTVKITQANAATGPCAFHGYISGDYDVRAQFGVTLDATKHFAVTDCSETAKKWTEGMTKQFWGYVIGSHTYKTALGGSYTVPAFKLIAML